MLKLIIVVITSFIGFLLLGGWGVLMGCFFGVIGLVFGVSNNESSSVYSDSKMFADTTNPNTIDLDENHDAVKFSDSFLENDVEVYKEIDAVNPATGLPMVGGIGGVDAGGSPFGTDIHENTTSIIDDSLNSTGIDDTFSNDGFNDTFSGGGLDDSFNSGFDDNNF